jgi:hypothetical protein
LQPRVTGKSRGTHRIDINEQRRADRRSKAKEQKMSTFSISDITPTGAYINAMNAAHNSDRRNADCYTEISGSRQKKSHGAWYSLPVRITAAGMVFAGYIMGVSLVVVVAT